MTPKLAVLAGKEAAPLEAILAKTPVSLIVDDQMSSEVILFANRNSIPYVLMSKDGRPDEEYNSSLVELLRRRDITLVALAGFGHEVGTDVATAANVEVVRTSDPGTIHRQWLTQRGKALYPEHHPVAR